MNAIVLSALVVIAAPAPPYRPKQKFAGTINAFWRVTDTDLKVSFGLCFSGRSETYVFNNKSEAYSKGRKVDMDPLHVKYLNHKSSVKVTVESHNNVITKITFEEGFP